MEQWQRESMGNLFKYVKDNVPYYSMIMKDVNFNCSIESIYSELPYQVKAMMRDSPEFINQSINCSNEILIKKLTGGTTGEPWCIIKTSTEYTKYFHILWKSRMQFGISPKEHFYQFGGYGDIDGVFTTKQIIESKAFTELSLFHLNDEVLDSYIDVLRLEKGTWFFANPSALYLLALRMKDRGIKGIGKIKYVELTGERVYHYQEELIREVFDCPISIMYGSREITTISHRCKYGYNHVLPNLFIETINDDLKPINNNKDELGEVVITSFIDKYMPFIKYRTGDYAVLKRKDDCPCGSKGLVFEKLLGRTPAYFEIDGEKYHMEISYYLMDKFNRVHKSGIRQFQVVFKKPNRLYFRFILDNPGIEDLVYRFYKTELIDAVPGVKFEAEFVKVINREKRKFNPYIIEK